MSDTDDTDLLLLIPPDFFLVRSDLEDFDFDSDTGFGSQEVQNTIVSDLITQVNDLESRICHIESLERCSTRCSTCNDDSFVNQSIISLTESDLLRAQIKETREFSKKGEPSTPLMVKSLNNDTSPLTFKNNDRATKASKFNLLQSEVVKRVTENNLKGLTIDADVSDKSNLGISLETATQNKPLDRQSQFSREKQAQLLNEVDSFLTSKQFNASEFRELAEDSELQTIGKGGHEIIQTMTNNVSNHLPHLSKGYGLEVNDEAATQSLALTEVYKLISEMEETQSEMQNKLNLNSPKLSSQSQGKDDTAKTSMPGKSFGQLYNSKVIDIDDLSTKAPLYKNKSSGVMETFRNEDRPNYNTHDVLDVYRLSNNPERNQMLTHPPVETEEKLNHVTSKPLSPNRIVTGSYNPIDILRGNASTKHDGRDTQFGDEKQSPNRSTGFRRQLNFEKPLSPLRKSKSSTSSLVEQRSYNPNENQNKSNRFVTPLLRTSRLGKTNHSLEDKFNTLTVQRTSGTSLESRSSQPNVMNKPVNDALQPKISSNNLLSLSELWNKEPTFYSDDPNKLRQKLEEEKYRRQHCEQQIQTLQLRVLEEQEKLAVAVRVDQEKDRAIMQITESWRRLNEHWGELEEQRHGLAQQLQAERGLAKSRSEELTKKVERWEKEVSQALDLAAGYKEKSEAVQKQMETLKRETDEKLQDAKDQLQNLTGENEKLIGENTSLTDQVKSLQERLNEEEDLLSKLKTELEKSRKRQDEYEAENSILKEQKSSLTIGVKEERNRISILEQKLNSLQHALNEASKKEVALREEARAGQERVEVARTELRALYQGQLEAVVKEKLQEFQAQLEAAEAALRAELANKERQWADKAAEQCRHLTDKYKRDLLRVEEIHKGDVNSWREKLMESERLRAAAEKKLQEEAERRADIAQRLHSVMETQWREALNIISNPIKAFYEVPKGDNPSKWVGGQQREQSPERLGSHGDARVSRSDSAASLGPGEEAPFCREGLVTYRGSQSQPSDDQLKKYINMLLERGPGNPLAPQEGTEPQAFCSTNNLLDKWIMDNDKKTAGQDRQNQLNKPPWR